jgi:cell division protein FtsW
MGQGGEQLLLIQLKWCGFGLAACLAAAALDYRLLKRFYFPCLLLGLALVLLALVLEPSLGRRVNGARRWIFGFQPSELAKIALVIVLAYYCEHYQRQMRTLLRGLVYPGVMIGLTLVLIFKEPDWGTTILLAAMSGALLLIAGTRLCYLMPTGLALVAALALLLHNNPMRLDRFKAWPDPEPYKDGVGYQTWRALLAFGTGGWEGLGLGNSRQKLGYLPEHQTDFIFPVIGEELGLIATLAVVVAFAVLTLCGAYIASHARDVFGFLLGSGLTLLIGLQAAINIGVVTGVVPNKGLPLPFISYGGSNLLITLTSVGLLVSIARRAAEAQADESHSLPDAEVAA